MRLTFYITDNKTTTLARVYLAPLGKHSGRFVGIALDCKLLLEKF